MNTFFDHKCLSPPCNKCVFILFTLVRLISKKFPNFDATPKARNTSQNIQHSITPKTNIYTSYPENQLNKTNVDAHANNPRNNCIPSQSEHNSQHNGALPIACEVNYLNHSGNNTPNKRNGPAKIVPIMSVAGIAAKEYLIINFTSSQKGMSTPTIIDRVISGLLSIICLLIAYKVLSLYQRIKVTTIFS